MNRQWKYAAYTKGFYSGVKKSEIVKSASKWVEKTAEPGNTGPEREHHMLSLVCGS